MFQRFKELSRGKTAVLIEPTQFLGGLTTGGLGATDIGNKRAIGGMSREFYANIFTYYADPVKWKQQTREQYYAKRPHGNSSTETTMWTFEPHAATEIYDAMLAKVKNKVTVVEGVGTVTAKGTLVNCDVVSESPENYGFGDAAIRLSKIFRMRPKTSDGAAVEGGTVRIPLAFRLDS